MKLSSMLGAAVLAAFAATALMGATSASAEVQLCKANEQPCSEANSYPLPRNLWMRLKTGTSLEIVGKEKFKCSISKFEGGLHELSEGQVQVVGQISPVWTFEGCFRGIEECEITSLALPYTLHVWQDTGKKGNGHMAWGPEEEGKERPGFKVECPFFGGCVFKAFEKQEAIGGEFEQEEVWINTQITGGNPPFAPTFNQKAKRTTLETTIGKMPCGNTVELIAEYEGISPNPLYVVHK